METAPLKNFATWARTSLIREVTARITAVLAPGSTARVEQPRAVAALEKAVHTAGGGDKGRASVADTVAYTWFNRIIALRFMDANGYTGIGVVSPQAGVAVGQPEILAEAKRGVIDAEVASQKTRATVAGLLDGSRASGDPQGEAYAVLLADYCRHWNKAMPFMFEQEGDFTELLIPANLLADDSLLNRAVQVLTQEVCQDVEVIGWLYQFYISERKDEVFAGFKNNKKAGADEIPAATQLFTPHWIVRFLVENSLGRLWMLNRPTSRLVEQMDYYIAPVEVESDFLKIAKPEELRLIDPACGSGHMLTYAFDLLYSIYEEEGYGPAEIPGLILTHNLYGAEIDARAGALAAFALTMKARGRQRTYFNKQVEANICVIDPLSFSPNELDFLFTKDGDKGAEGAFWNQFSEADTLGSLIMPDPDLTDRLARHLKTLRNDDDLLKEGIIERAHRAINQAECLARRYAVTVANPPYMGAKSMDQYLATHAKEYFPNSKSDLFAMFIERCIAFAAPHGLVGMITMQSWMFGSSLGELRSSLLSKVALRAMAHLGSGAFDTISGEVVTTTAFIVEPVVNPHSRVGAFVDLTLPSSEARKDEALRCAVAEAGALLLIPMSNFTAIPGQPIAYWAADEALEAFREFPALSSIADLKAGISTGDNSTFERLWFEVSAARLSPTGSARDIGQRKWTPCSSGGRFRRWYGNNEVVMDWESDGARVRAHRGSAVRNPSFMGRGGLTYSKIGGARFAVRELPPGFVFDDTGRMIFPHRANEQLTLAALLNSSTAQYFLDLMSPGLTFTSNEIGKVPLAPLPVRVSDLAQLAIQIAKEDWDSTEMSWDFSRSPLVGQEPGVSTSLRREVAALLDRAEAVSEQLHAIEEEINSCVSEAYGLARVVRSSIAVGDVSLTSNAAFVYGPQAGDATAEATRDSVRNLVSFAVGCMFGRYSLDVPGLVLANEGAKLQDFLVKVPAPTYMPDADNVIPIVEGDWFDDDIVERFRQFLRAAFGEEYFEENLRFVTESLGVKSLRDYFVKSFYKDHVQRYKKRPIYWLFSSPNGSFNALIYMHRYMPSTVSTVLNEYLREFQAKLKSSLEHAERSNNGKDADRLRKILLELDGYEHDILYPLASQNIAIDLDDGVKANYPKFGAALKKIVGLEASE